MRLSNSFGDGIPLDPGASHTLGAIDGIGWQPLTLAWPLGLPRTAPRREALLAIATAAPVDLGVLETAQRPARLALAATAAPLAWLCAQLSLGGPRTARRHPGGYALARGRFWLDPMR